MTGRIQRNKYSPARKSLAESTAAGLSVIGFKTNGDSWPQAIVKGLWVTAWSAGLSFGGAAGGAFFGGSFVPADLTGISEVFGAVAGAAGGGYLGGVVGTATANVLFGP